MQIVQTLAGYSLGRADILRRAMSKKKSDAMERERQSFIFGDAEVEGAVKRGVDQVTASGIFDEMAEFTKYAFNKSHAAAYAQIAYQTAWLKTFYPAEFMAALMSTHLDDTPKITQYIAEMSKLGIRLVPPDINKSGADFTASGNNITFGLAAIKNVGRSFVEQIKEERKKGPFKSLTDFCTRMYDKGINKRAVESLIRAGAFDSLGGFRSQYLCIYERVMNETSSESRTNLSGQISLLGEGDFSDNLPDIAEFNRRELLAMEKEVTGIYISGHPLDSYKEALLRNSSTTINEITASRDDEQNESLVADGQQVRIAGIITKKITKFTKKDEEMAFITIEDLSGSIEVIVFPGLLSQFEQVLREDAVVSIIGRVNAREDEQPKIIMDGAYAVSNETLQYRLYIKIPAGYKGSLSELTQVLRIFSGDTPVYLYFEKDKKTVCAPKECNVTPGETLYGEIKKILGDNCETVLKKINS